MRERSAAKTPEAVPVYHGADLDEAYKRAKTIGGMVIWSAAPGTNGAGPTAKEAGYWSEVGGFVRSWEREVYSAHQHRSLAAVRRAEVAFAGGVR